MAIGPVKARISREGGVLTAVVPARIDALQLGLTLFGIVTLPLFGYFAHSILQQNPDFQNPTVYYLLFGFFAVGEIAPSESPFGDFRASRPFVSILGIWP